MSEADDREAEGPTSDPVAPMRLRADLRSGAAPDDALRAGEE